MDNDFGFIHTPYLHLPFLNLSDNRIQRIGHYRYHPRQNRLTHANTYQAEAIT